ncbi:MAG: 3-hydroxyisobutyrate dehydrogenase [Gaiellales bacterium]|jgi:3-hydroxyisobutyrate dehydrogenase|nr:3-hydroxyisobutyrate dehydrogenase [Gaiellales bacterium]
MTIGFVGLGRMGGPMAANLVAAGHRVRGFDIVDEAGRAAARAGVEIVPSLAEAAEGASAIITMLPDGPLVHECYEGDAGLLANAEPAALLIDCSTIDSFDARALHELVSRARLRPLDAPVSGGVVGATAGTLTFMVGGAARDVREAEPLLLAMGRRVVHCGEGGTGQAAKACNNMLLGISMIGVGEAFVLAEALGLSHQALFDVASTSSGACWALTTNCPVPGLVPTSPADNGYKAGFAVNLMLKDLRLARDAALAGGAITELGLLATDIYERLAADGAGDEDFSTVYRAIRSASKAAHDEREDADA